MYFSTPPASSGPLGDTGLNNCTAAQESPHQHTLRLQQPLRTARTDRRTCDTRPCAATVAQDSEASVGRGPEGSPDRDPKLPGCKLRAERRVFVSGRPVLGLQLSLVAVTTGLQLPAPCTVSLRSRTTRSSMHRALGP